MHGRSAVCADLLTLLSRIPPSGGNVFVIIMPRFTVRQGNSITGVRTGPAFVRPRVEPQAAVAVPPLFLSLAPKASFSLPPRCVRASGAIIVSQLTAFLQEGTACMTTTFREAGRRLGRCVSACVGRGFFSFHSQV